MSTGTINFTSFLKMLDNPSEFLPGLTQQIEDESDPTKKEKLTKLVEILSKPIGKPIASATLDSVNGGKSRRRRRHRRSSKKHKKARKSRRANRRHSRKH